MTSIEKTDGSGDYYADGQAIPGEGNPQAVRRSHLFFGCCCDTRRATIVVNIVNASLSAIAIIGLAVVASPGFSNQVDDDAVKQDLARAQQYIWVPILISCICIAFSLLGIYGAIKYNGNFVIAAAVWYCVSILLSILGGDIGGVIIQVIFVYPHFVLYNEMKQGIITEATYPTEKYSCCCV